MFYYSTHFSMRLRKTVAVLKVTSCNSTYFTIICYLAAPWRSGVRGTCPACPSSNLALLLGLVILAQTWKRATDTLAAVFNPTPVALHYTAAVYIYLLEQSCHQPFQGHHYKVIETGGAEVKWKMEVRGSPLGDITGVL
jgi:hypothetical protein